MMEVELRTDEGAVIGRFSIPPFPDPPPILFWEGRIFEWTSFDTVYREVEEFPPTSFTYRIVTPMR